MPVSPSTTTSGTPPTAQATTGTPALAASSSANPKPFAVGGMREQIEARQELGQIAAETREQRRWSAKPALGELGAQPPLERAAAEAQRRAAAANARTSSGSNANSHACRLRSMSCATTPTTSASAGKPNAARRRSRAAESGR